MASQILQQDQRSIKSDKTWCYGDLVVNYMQTCLLGFLVLLAKVPMDLRHHLVSTMHHAPLVLLEIYFSNFLG